MTVVDWRSIFLEARSVTLLRVSVTPLSSCRLPQTGRIILGNKSEEME